MGIMRDINFNGEMSFASGYYRIRANGIVEFAEDTPDEIKEKFWAKWKVLRPKVIECQRNLCFSSRMPFLPDDDVDPNEYQYRE